MSVLVAIHPELEAISDQAILDLEVQLRSLRLRTGLIISPEQTLGLVQSGWGPGSVRQYGRKGPSETSDLFKQAGIGSPTPGRLGLQVRHWIDALRTNWMKALSPKSTPWMFPDFVGGFAQADIEAVDA
ncbi:MAG: hypothetical protein HY791_03925 [Deltaproteobacteria bacterium]|nr:hypothetical protein [Deltaproteobacteria bacterium]